MHDKRLEELEEMIDGFDDLSDKAKGHIIGTLSTVFALYTPANGNKKPA